MQITSCRQLQPVLERYLAQEASPEERLRVQEHIKCCHRCHDAVRAQEAVRQLLRRRAAEARAEGVAPPWTPRASRFSPPRTAAILGLILVPTVGLLLFAVMYDRSASGARSWSAVGVITDDRCGAGHHRDDASTCIRDCVRQGAKYVFVSRGVTYLVGNQDFRGLAPLAAQEVRLTGHIQKDAVIVSRLDPVN
jgi:hypothetical protein